MEGSYYFDPHSPEYTEKLKTINRYNLYDKHAIVEQTRTCNCITHTTSKRYTHHYFCLYVSLNRFVFLGTIPIVLLYWLSYFVIMTRPSEMIKEVGSVQEHTRLIREGGGDKSDNKSGKLIASVKCIVVLKISHFIVPIMITIIININRRLQQHGLAVVISRFQYALYKCTCIQEHMKKKSYLTIFSWAPDVFHGIR